LTEPNLTEPVIFEPHIANGARFVTYAIEGEPGSGVVQEALL